MWPRIPLRLRLTLAFALAMAAVLAVVGGLLYAWWGEDLRAGVDFGLRSRAAVVVSALAQRAPVELDARPTLIDEDEAFAQILDDNGSIVDTTTAVASAPMLPASLVRAADAPAFYTRSVRGLDEPARLLAVPTGPPGHRLVVVVGATLGDRTDALGRLLLLLLIGGPLALLLASAAGWLAAGTALRPMERIRVQAAAITASDVDRQLPVPATGDELTRLAVTLNGMLDRLREAMQREHQFLDVASHELRTPLSVLKAELDLALTRPRSREELTATVRSAAFETDTLVRLAEDLLVLARTNRGRVPVRREWVPLGHLLRQAATPFEVRATACGARITVAAADDPVHVDPVRVRQAVHNLIDNALRHGGTATPIAVSGCRDGATVRIAVRDSGRGFAPDALAHAFEPFAPGTVVPNGTAGTGLGLAIVRAVAEAHGGTAAAGNAPGGGARIVVTLKA